MNLVTLETNAFTATVPDMLALPQELQLSIVYENSSMLKYAKVAAAFHEVLPQDKQQEFEELCLADSLEVLSLWIGATIERHKQQNDND